jgi:hypothetical protein
VTDERRRNPRVLTGGSIQARVLGRNLDLDVLDLSVGGFRAESHLRISVGRTYVCEIGATGVGTVTLAVKAVYCRPMTADPQATFDVGFAFLNPGERAVHAAVGMLLEHVTSVLEFE